MGDLPTVLCIKWGTLYGPDYVNVLHRAARAHLDRPFRFLCLTDDGTGLDPEVEVAPIPDLGLTEAQWRKGGWPKLSLFKPGAVPPGRVLFLDLDIVICGDLGALLDHPGGFVMVREWPRLADLWRPRKERGCSAVFSFTADDQAQILSDFQADPDAAIASHRQEQMWVQARARDLSFFPDDWTPSFKRTLSAPPLLDRLRGPAAPGPDARVVVFHGEPRPIDLVPDRGQRWGAGLRYGRGAVGWMRDYWLRFGGAEPH